MLGHDAIDIEAGGEDYHADFLAEGIVEHGTPDDLDVGVDVGDEIVEFRNLLHRDGMLVGETNLKEEVFGPRDVIVEEEG